MQGKPIRQAFYPLASTPEIQHETMKKLGIDTRSAEERLMDEIKKEQEELKQGEVSSMGMPLQPGQQEIILNPGQSQVPQVSMIIDKSKNYAPKQNLSKPEKSI